MVPDGQKVKNDGRKDDAKTISSDFVRGIKKLDACNIKFDFAVNP